MFDQTRNELRNIENIIFKTDIIITVYLPLQHFETNML